MNTPKPQSDVEKLLEPIAQAVGNTNPFPYEEADAQLINAIDAECATLWNTVLNLPKTPFKSPHDSLSAIAAVGEQAKHVQTLYAALDALRELSRKYRSLKK